MNIMPVLLKDGYKTGHIFQYPKDTLRVYSNFTPRRSRTGIDKVVVFGVQYFVREYLFRQFYKNFFDETSNRIYKVYKRRMDNYLGKDSLTIDHIMELHKLGYLPIQLKSLDEGSVVPLNIPILTITNTLDKFFWLTNMLETLLSNILWMPCTSATTALEFRKNFQKYANLTDGNKDFVAWQGHDFSFRGMPGIEAAMLSGAAHLLSFTGTDTIPAIDFLEEYYYANSDRELIGGSVAATEHSVMCMGKPEGEFATFKKLITEIYPGDTQNFQIVSIVSDTWDLWEVVTNYLPRLKKEILARNGKVVIRPDSGDPVKIICGDPDSSIPHVQAGLIESLWNIFSGTVNDQGYKTLDFHIGAIYGDSINLERQVKILEGLRQKGFASDNIVLGMGSYTYQYVTRDNYSFAMKATAGITKENGLVNIFKDPKTDDGTKKSHTGLLKVIKDSNGNYQCLEQVTEEEEKEGELKKRFRDGIMPAQTNLHEIRERLKSHYENV
jgi:nicotinamide phosphoribosyltransferase